MLLGLSIRDVVLIERLDLEFGPGLWVLTGETGAGKSILLDALSLATGARADRSLIRAGQAQASVTAEFEVSLDHQVWRIMSTNGLGEGPELILRRLVSADGRSRAFINDQPVSVATLQEIGELLLEVHGQHDDRVLLNPAVHREFLDSFGALEKTVAQVGVAYGLMTQSNDRLKAEREMTRNTDADALYLRHAIEELGNLSLQDNEEEALALERATLMNAEKISRDLAEARAALTDDRGLDSRLNGALKSLERASAKVPGVLDNIVAALDRALVETNEARVSIEAVINTLEFDDHKLEQAEERLFALRAAARKYNIDVNGLAAVRRDFEAQLSRLDNRRDHLAQLEKDAVRKHQAFLQAAKGLSAKRRKAAKKLDIAVAMELPPLKLEKAVFNVAVESVDSDKAGPYGIDRVRYLVSTNPGTPSGPLTQIASGGELARFVLALKVALARRGTTPTMIFDEVDRGVGGAVADAVGERLARLSHDAQVLMVTHSPQVAARAHHHLRVEKRTESNTAITDVHRLTHDQRIEEIARMLSAAQITDEARSAAVRLLSHTSALDKTGTAG